MTLLLTNIIKINKYVINHEETKFIIYASNHLIHIFKFYILKVARESIDDCNVMIVTSLIEGTQDSIIYN